VNGPSSRVVAGGYIMAFATGEGATDIAVDGMHVSLLGPYPKPVLGPWTATVGGKPAIGDLRRQRAGQHRRLVPGETCRFLRTSRPATTTW
jgi:hypothetical protein